MLFFFTLHLVVVHRSCKHTFTYIHLGIWQVQRSSDVSLVGREKAETFSAASEIFCCFEVEFAMVF